MDVLVMAALGALVGAGLLAVAFTLAGEKLFPGFSRGAETVLASSERLVFWLFGAFVLAAIVWGWTSWPVAGGWAFAAVLSIPLLSRGRVSIDDEIAKVEAIATWSEQIRDTMNASAGLQQALVASAVQGPEPIAIELREFARRAPRGDLTGALRQLGADLHHPSADLVIAGLLSATELDAGRLIPLLSRLASSIRDEASMRVRIEVGRARIRTSMKIVAVCITATALLLLITAGELLSVYDTAAGQMWLLVVGAMVVVAVWSSRKLSQVPQPERFVARRMPQ